jgi:hypothetical protein
MFDQGIGVASTGVAEGRMLGLWYDPDRLIIEGVYCDEVTAYRARRRWIEALKVHFLLDEGLDFSLRVRMLRGDRHFKVQCSFLTACGRYAFWRLTHHQALEVQCILETAHLPRSLCTLSVDSLMDEVDFPIEMERAQQRREYSYPTNQRERAWVKAMRRIQQLANRIVGVTRSSARSGRDYRE